MRKQLNIFLCVGLLATAPLWAADNELDDVLNNFTQAIGGDAAIQNIQTAKASGTMVFAGGLEAPFSIEFQPPQDRMRLDFEFQGMNAVNAYDGESGWAIQPFLGKTTAEPIAADELRQARDQADFFGPLINYSAKGHSLELVGKTDVEGTDAYDLKLTKANGDIENWYLDSEYYLPFRVITNTQIQGQAIEVTTTYGDYKEVGDMVFAHSIDIEFGAAGRQSIVIKNMELNPEIDEKRFFIPTTEAG